MKIIQKLMLGFLIIIVLAGILGIISIGSIKKIGSEIKTHHILQTPVKSAIVQVRIDLDKVMRATEEYDADWMTKEESTEEIEEKKERIKKQLVYLFATTDLVVFEKAKELDASINEFYGISAKLFKVHGKSREEKVSIMKEFDEKVGEIGEKLDIMMDKINKVAETSSASIRDTIVFSYKFSILVFAVIILFALGIALVISRNISRRITKLKDATEEIGKGELDTKLEINSKDEIGFLAASFNKMAEDLKKTTTSIVVLNKEIDERKIVGEKLKVAYERLRQTQFQLVQSAKMASLGVLAGGIAHEINNPLTGVLNNAQLIKMIVSQKEGFDRDEFNKVLDEIEESAQRCTQITSSLLEFSRSSKGNFGNLFLNEIAEKVFVIVEKELKLQNINILKEFAPDLPFINADSQLLQQVVFDTINNAKQAIQKKSGKEGGTITLRTYNIPKEKSVCLAISDTGTGISQENIKRIFEPFFTTKPIGEGTGLGLSIITDIVKLHKGTIDVESIVGEGATFKIILPAVV